jgi:uncharacterized phage protein (TIGR01671 family)
MKKYKIWRPIMKSFTTDERYIRANDGELFSYEEDYGGTFSSHEKLEKVNGVLVQWTGCYDKNRTPIYEGDIISTDHDGGEGEANIGVVYFAAGTYMIDGDGPFYDHVYGHSPDILDNHTVIGNKFENPELLKQ